MKIDPKSSAIVFKNWRIYAPIATIANQYDNRSRMLRVEGNMPDGYRWDMLVQCGENYDIIPLSDLPVPLNEVDGSMRQKIIGAILTADQLSESGTYDLQLRGILLENTEVKRHTNVISVRIPKTLIGDGTWPEIPTSFTELEQNILEVTAHPPIPGTTGYWKIWDVKLDMYVPSDIPLPPVAGGIAIIDAEISNQGDLIAKFSDDSEKNLGRVVGEDGAVYVPSVSEHKVLSFTIEDEPNGVPNPVDLNPHDEWGDIEDGGATDYIWEEL